MFWHSNFHREYNRNSVEDIRRLPNKQRTPGSTSLYDRTPTSPSNPSAIASPAIYHPTTPVYIPAPSQNNSIVGRVEHLLNQTEHILSRTESLDSSAQSTGLQRLLSHKEQLEHVEKLLAQAEYAIWVEKRNCAQQVSQLSPSDSHQSQYGFSQGGPTTPTGNPLHNPITPSFPSTNTNSASGPTQTHNSGGNHGTSSTNKNSNSTNSGTDHHHHRNPNQTKKLSKNLEEESVV